MADIKVDLMMIKALCKEALRLKKDNVCKLTLYSYEAQVLLKILEELIANKPAYKNFYDKIKEVKYDA